MSNYISKHFFKEDLAMRNKMRTSQKIINKICEANGKAVPLCTIEEALRRNNENPVGSSKKNKKKYKN